MKRNKKLAVSVISFALAFTCLIGGTYAWYVVSNTAKATFSGNTAKASEGLEFGYVNGDSLDATASNVQWATTNETLNLNTFAPTDGFFPLTSKTYADNQTITLYEAPKYRVANNTTVATEGFAQFELVFKSAKQDAAIYLDEALTSFTDSNTDKSVIKALRIGFEAGNVHTIYNPHPDRGLTETTNVGGRMDLNGDGVWDYDYNASTGEYSEIVYGEATSVVTTKTQPTDAITPKPVSNKDALDAKSVRQNDYHGTTNYVASLTPNKQVSHGSKYYVHDATDDSKNHPLVKTSNKIGDYYYGVLKVTMWIEGWDPACRYDLTASQTFSYTFGFVAPELVSADGQQF